MIISKLQEISQFFLCIKVIPKHMLLCYDSKEKDLDKEHLRSIMEALIILILKCILLGIIWAALLIPVLFNRGGWLKYIITVIIIAVLCFLLRGFAATINKMTVIALVTLVISWITSMAVFDKESKIKSKVISFACVMAAAAYLISCFVSFSIL